MPDLKIPNLNKNSDKFLFKKKLSLRRKSKRKLFKESFVMFFLSVFIIYVNNIIPNKKILFNSFSNNFFRLIANIFDSLFYCYEISMVIFIVISLIFALILMLGAFSRLVKIVKRKSKQITFR